MNLLVVLLIVILLVGGGGWYGGLHNGWPGGGIGYGGTWLGLIVLVVIVLALTGRL
jgi:hypothetical protein